ncbi:NAD(P)-binding protein [Coniochaeta ligniaria NRRL 30616]|uniref:NAD(P)-binding protein n=1 Tax=Coniochaeta ligniaria NRRL 30616 TaxID=1408157 RepID=A0A1J7IYR5_9PEZI|nr:NAD(P)-binding protein [Coniochaeta ligniaria NRRL 30616]
MAQRFPSVAVVGATGNVGFPILKALASAHPPFDSITVLTRSPPANPSIFPPSVTIKTADYTSHSDLISALTGIDAIVFAVGSPHTLSQIPIIDAAVEAGVKFIIPTEYGLPSNLAQFEDFHAFAAKRAVQKHLIQPREQGKIDYTFVFVGLWIDVTGLGGFLIDVKNKKQELWDGGEHPISLTSTASIAKAVVGILEGKAAGKTEVRIKDINLSQKRLFELSAEVVGKDGWEVTHLDTEDRTKVARQRFRDGNATADDHYSFVKRGAAVPGYDGPWTTEEDDSAALGLREWTESDVVEFIRADCNKPYKSAKYLERHLRTASAHAAKSFQCEFAGCSKTFSRKDECSRHQKKAHPAPADDDHTTNNAVSAVGKKRKRDDTDVKGSDSGDKQQTALVDATSLELARVEAENKRLKLTVAEKDDKIGQLENQNAHLLA